MSDDVSAAVHAFLAGERLEQTRDYLTRGRALEGQDSTMVAARWIFEMQRYAARPRGFNRTMMEDAESELGLRGMEVPYHLVEKDVDELVRVGDEILAEATDEQKANLNAEILEKGNFKRPGH